MKYAMFLTLLTVMPLMAQDFVDRGWYAGIEVGQGSLEDSSDETMAGIFGGFQFNRYFALEGGYQQLDTVEDPGGSDAPGEADVEGWKLVAVGKWPLAPRFSLLGKGGLYGSSMDSIVFSPETRRRENETDIGLAFEGGLEFKLAPQWRAELVYGNYTTDSLTFVVMDNQVEVTNEIESLTTVKVGVSYVF